MFLEEITTGVEEGRENCYSNNNNRDQRQLRPTSIELTDIDDRKGRTATPSQAVSEVETVQIPMRHLEGPQYYRDTMQPVLSCVGCATQR